MMKIPVKNNYIWLIILQITTYGACSQDERKTMHFMKTGYNFPYNLSTPDRTWKLPGILYEISGVSYIDDQRLACVQDEKGMIFIFNKTAGNVERTISFGEDGDYEGIELIGNDAWILKSNGTLLEVKDYLNSEAPQVNKYSTPLSGKNDTEGLAHDKESNSLLIACKEQAFVKAEDMTGSRAIYRFDLKTGLLAPEPYMIIKSEQHIGNNKFKPSGMAIHPVTGDIYIIASAGKLMFVFSREKEMLAIIKLDPKLFPQPEGICFSPDGRLYISSEGAGGAGKILSFEPQK